MKWPNLIQSFGYNIYHSLKKTRTIMQIENSGATYEGNNHSPKYVYINSQCPLTSISFEIRNITLDDAGFYSVDTTDKFSINRGVFLIVEGKYLKVTNLIC